VALPREIQVYTVAELDRRLKRAVEGATAAVWVEGEVSGAKPAPSGHVYFSLKDEREDAILECVMYRSSPVRARHLIVDGARVQLRGQATVWARADGCSSSATWLGPQAVAHSSRLSRT